MNPDTQTNEVARLREQQKQLLEELNPSLQKIAKLKEQNQNIRDAYLKSVELLNRAIEMLTAVTWGDEGRDYDWQKVMKDLEKLKNEARLAAAPEEADHIVEANKMVPEWREIGPDEVIQNEDEINLMGRWGKVGISGRKPSEYVFAKFRTHRPLPKSEDLSDREATEKQPVKSGDLNGDLPLPKQEMPLEKELDYLTREASRASDIHNHVMIVDCLRYLRDEIEQLKKNQK